jgi:hypothetical protein
MQPEPTRSPAHEDQDPNQEQQGDNDLLLTLEQEAAMFSEYGSSIDDSKCNLEDPDSDEPPIKNPDKSNQKPTQNFDENLPINQFHNHYVGYMDLFADQQTVMKYLDAHQGWFKRCAHPFKADPIGETGYAMGVGQVGALGFNVDPRVGLNLLPPDANAIYRITTIPIPDQLPQGYEVDFHAEMRLEEKILDLKAGEQSDKNPVMTCIEWDLKLTVTLQFPTFIQRLSKDMLQKTGDGVLGFVVARVSKSLTPKVQADFHKTHDIKVPKHIKLRR